MDQRNASGEQEDPLMMDPARLSPAASSRVLVRWTYTGEEWQRFDEWERGERNWVHFIFSLIIALIATLFLRLAIHFSWGASMAVGGVCALIYGLSCYFLLSNRYRSSRSRLNQIVITDHSVVINNKRIVFSNEQKILSGVEILEDPDPRVFEIKYHRINRKQKTIECIYVPIPKGKLGEAVLLMEEVRRGMG